MPSNDVKALNTCSVLQCVAMCCSCAVRCSMLSQLLSGPLPMLSSDVKALDTCSVLQCDAVCCSVLQCIAMH